MGLKLDAVFTERVIDPVDFDVWDMTESGPEWPKTDLHMPTPGHLPARCPRKRAQKARQFPQEWNSSLEPTRPQVAERPWREEEEDGTGAEGLVIDPRMTAPERALELKERTLQQM